MGRRHDSLSAARQLTGALSPGDQERSTRCTGTPRMWRVADRVTAERWTRKGLRSGWRVEVSDNEGHAILGNGHLRRVPDPTSRR